MPRFQSQLVFKEILAPNMILATFCADTEAAIQPGQIVTLEVEPRVFRQ